MAKHALKGRKKACKGKLKQEAKKIRKEGAKLKQRKAEEMAKATAVAAAKAKSAAPAQRLFRKEHAVLLVGEGNFSFGAAVAAELRKGGGELVATSYDDARTVAKKYPDAEAHLEAIRTAEGQVIHSVDATQLSKLSHWHQKFHRIIFNFPHLGTGEADVDKSVRAHQKLLASFFAGAKRLLAPGPKCAVCVTLKKGEPYDSWRCGALAKRAQLRLRTAIAFEPASYPGYEHRRTLGFDASVSKADNLDISKGAKTFVYGLPSDAEDAEE